MRPYDGIKACGKGARILAGRSGIVRLRQRVRQIACEGSGADTAGEQNRQDHQKQKY